MKSALFSVHFSKFNSVNDPTLINAFFFFFLINAFMFTRLLFYITVPNSNLLSMPNGPTSGDLP